VEKMNKITKDEHSRDGSGTECAKGAAGTAYSPIPKLKIEMKLPLLTH